MLYLWFIQYWCHKNDRSEIDFVDFSERIFPRGFPSEKDLFKIWGNQKVSGGGLGLINLVDYPNAGLSIIKTK